MCDGAEWDLAPPDATMTDRTNLRRCWKCDFYSFKVYGDEDNTQGKCFRDRSRLSLWNKTWWVDGMMTCPRFIPKVLHPE